LGGSALVGGLIAGSVFLWYQGEISGQQSSNGILAAEITRLEGQIKEIGGLETEIAALKARQQAVEDLQSDRNLPVHLLTELVKQLPDGVFIARMAQVEQSVTINGTAQSNERVSELLRNLGNNTPWFSKPELVEIVAGSMVLPTKEQKRVSNFVIKVRLVRAVEAEKSVVPAAAASAPMASASAPVAASSSPVKQ
jgi:type IV pilus assembly protein PilN